MAIKLFGSMVNLHPSLGNNFIDANALDLTGGPQDAAVDRILALAEDGQFTLLLPYSVKREIEHPHTPAEVKRQASRLAYSIPVQLTVSEMATHQRIRALIQGNAQPSQHVSDAFHIVESAKNGGRHFITNDRRLLKKAFDIWSALLIRILTASEFINDYYPDSDSNEQEAKPQRQLVTREELDNILTSEIREIDDLEDAKLTFQYILREPDETGCNWTGAVLNPGSRGSPEYGAPYAHSIVVSARARYNVKD